MRQRRRILAAGLLVLSLGAVGVARAAGGRHAAGPTSPATTTVIAGWASATAVANIFTPQSVVIYVGDTVTWRVAGTLEPHTISFGPFSLLYRLADNAILPLRQKAGPPLVLINPRIAQPTPGHTYAGTGFANSGLLSTGQRWSLTFTKPGTYRYYCLEHFSPTPHGDRMSGEVIVRPRPRWSHVYHVLLGSPGDTLLSFSASFSPRRLTIHAGDTVVWDGYFHTVTFGPAALIHHLEKAFREPVPGQPTETMVNPQAVFRSGGRTYDGHGFVNSGWLLPFGPFKKPFALTFTRPGTYAYDCLIHPGMDGTITVLPATA